MKPKIILMNLLSPLLYIPVESSTLEYEPKDGEKLFCFELEESEAQKFEPDKHHFPGSLIFVGKAPDMNEPAVLELKPGTYLFSQVREILNPRDIVDLAVEVHNEGLWQRLKLSKRLYIRFLFEDGRGVTQIWRAFTR